MDTSDVKWRPHASRWITLGAILAGIAVGMGALGAHGVDSALARNYAGETREIAGQTVPAASKYLEDFKTASRYQMDHALGMIVVGLLLVSRCSRLLNIAGTCFLLGILLFCGSLYTLSLTAHTLASGGRHALGLVAASGGVLFIIGWCCLAAAVCPCRNNGSCPQ